MLWLLGALGIGGAAALFLVPGLAANAMKALGALLGVVRAHPWQVALIIAVAGCGLIWRHDRRMIDQRDEAIAGRAADRAAYTEAQVEAARLALAAKAATEARYRANAERIDRAHETQLADARDATATYANAHRLRPKGSDGSTCDAPTAADHSNSSLLAGMPANPIVVGESDLQACAAATAYALDAREWALGLAE